MKTKIIALLAAGLACSVPGVANAALIITINQVGTDIVANGLGSVSTTGLQYENKNNYSVIIRPEYGAVVVGKQVPADLYANALVNKGNFGMGDTTRYPSSTAGDTFGIYAKFGYILLPDGYVSGSSLSGTATYAYSSYASLGLTQGSYLFNLVNGDTITVNVGAVPEPATWALMTLGMGAVGLAMRRRRKIATTVRYA